MSHERGLSPVTSGHCPAGTVERVTCWPQPEVPNNIDMTTGALGLTDTEENQIVAFLQTLTDGFNPANPTVSTYKNIDTFTGQCSTTLPGQTASTQGNELSHFCSGLFRFDILSQKPPFFGEIQRESGFLELWKHKGRKLVRQGGRRWCAGSWRAKRGAENVALALG
jgi:hypothetical protein